MLKKSYLAIIFFVVFLDLLSLGIVIPIVAPLFLGTKIGILDSSYPFSTRVMILGFLVASYPIAQFFGAPILGALSDRVGRKKILLLSLAGTFVGHLLSGIGIIISSISLLFLSRILDGFTGGNISVAYSAIADLSDEQSKAKNFGLIGVAFGLGFIIGPYIGGKLGDPSLSSWFTFATPFWFAAFLSFLNILFVFWKFQETLETRVQTKVSLFTGFYNIRKAFELANLRTMFAVIFLLSFGFHFFIQFFPVFLIEKFQFKQSHIGDTFAYIGLWIAVAQGGITRPLARKLLPNQVLLFSILMLGIAFFMLLLPHTPLFFLLILPFFAIFQGLTYPNATAIVSDLSTKESQGEVLGINQSIQSLAFAIPPIIAGFIVSIDLKLPIILASASSLIAWAIFLLFFKPKG